MCLRHTRLQNAVYLIHFYFLTKCAVRLVLFFYFSQNVAVFTIIFSIVFYFFLSSVRILWISCHAVSCNASF